jgi:hypothetical protein
MFAAIERFLQRLMAPYAQELARLPDSAFRALLARI